MPLVEYSFDENGRMTVANDTVRWYAYIDMTAQAEAEKPSFPAKYEKAARMEKAIQAVYETEPKDRS